MINVLRGNYFMSRNEDIKKLNELIKDVKIAMLTTEDTDGTLRSRPMGTQEVEFDGDLWFFTNKESAKVHEVESHKEVNVSYSRPDSNTFVSVSGKAEVVNDKAKMKDLWNPALKAWFPDGLNDPDITLLKISVNKAEYWDASSSKMVVLAKMAKAVITGQEYQADKREHATLKL